MADTTVVNPPASQDGGAVVSFAALIVMLVVLVGGFLWYRTYGDLRAAAPTPAGESTNINITLPEVPNTGTDVGDSGADEIK